MTDTTTLTLTDFLLARIAEEEDVARKALATRPAGWFDDDHDAWKLEPSMVGEYDDPNGCVEIAAPRVLAECEAKRRIVALHANRHNLGYCASCGEGWMDQTTGEGGYTPEPHPCLTLRNLALPYADHPDYREEWRP